MMKAEAQNRGAFRSRFHASFHWLSGTAETSMASTA